MMRRCQNKNAPPNPMFRAGLLVNALFLTLHGLLPDPCFGGLGEFFRGALAGLALAKAAMNTVFWVLHVVLTAGLFIALPLNRTVFSALLALLVLMSLSLLAAAVWHRRHM